MKGNALKLGILGSVLVVVGAVFSTSAASGEDPPKPDTVRTEAIVYVCPPCGCAADSKTFDAPGRCPDCQMGLVRRVAKRGPRNVAIIVFEGVNLLDFAGPAEVFSTAKGSNGSAYEVFTVASNKDAVESDHAVATVQPEYSIDRCPKPEVLVIPGGRVSALLNDARMMDWIKARGAESDMVLAVADGVEVLAKCGLLEDHQATIQRWAVKRLQGDHPRIRLVEGRRFVIDGKFATTSSVAGGMDAALQIVEKFEGPEAMVHTAHDMDYPPRSDRETSTP